MGGAFDVRFSKVVVVYHFEGTVSRTSCQISWRSRRRQLSRETRRHDSSPMDGRAGGTRDGRAYPHSWRPKAPVGTSSTALLPHARQILDLARLDRVRAILTAEPGVHPPPHTHP